MTNLFETARLGIIIALIAETLVFMGWAFARQRVRTYYLLIGPALFALAFALDALVETTAEELERVTREIVQAAEDEDAEALIDHFSPNLLINNSLGKRDAAQYIRFHLSKPLISNNIINELQIVSAAYLAGRVEFKVTTNIDSKSTYAMYRIVPSRWRFDFVRDSDGRYRISDMVMLSLHNGPGIDVFTRRRLDR